MKKGSIQESSIIVKAQLLQYKLVNLNLKSFKLISNKIKKSCTSRKKKLHDDKILFSSN